MPALEAYATRSREFGADHTALAQDLGVYAKGMVERDVWVGRIGEAFRQADRATGPVPPGVVLTTDEAVNAARERIALDIARQLLQYQDHPVNLSPELVQYAREVARQVGISEQLMLMILWQEQQWYQNADPAGPVDEFGQFFNWSLRELGIRPDKSLGVAHMKVSTLRDLIRTHHLTDVNGRDLNSYSDDELAKWLEVDQRSAIYLAGLYLKDLQHKQGDWSDKQTFYLYASDSDQVREGNRKFGDATEGRQNEIYERGKNWDRVMPAIDAALEWERLSPEERRRALETLAAQRSPDPPLIGEPERQRVHLNFPYPPPPGVQIGAEITKERLPPTVPPPPTSMPPPGPAPTPPPAPPPR
ncbi:MAG: hypothetical protein ACRDYX_05415 [Egibacteraceae bacterium]